MRGCYALMKQKYFRLEMAAALKGAAAILIPCAKNETTEHLL